jgi:hypothetical protein
MTRSKKRKVTGSTPVPTTTRTTRPDPNVGLAWCRSRPGETTSPNPPVAGIAAVHHHRVVRTGRSLVGVLVAALILATCAGTDPSDLTADSVPDVAGTTPEPGPEQSEVPEQAELPDQIEVVEFTWTTAQMTDGSGATVEVTGVVGDGWASYTMHATPAIGPGGGEYADLIPNMVGAGINGLVDTPTGSIVAVEIDPEGATDVRVEGDTRWYRLPWLLDEAPGALAGATWMQVDASADVPPVDLVSYVVAERFDRALSELRRAAGDRTGVTPDVQPDGDEVAALFGPWTGADAPVEPTGDAAAGAASWRTTYTYEPDGFDGFSSGEVRWRTTTVDHSDHLPPDRSIGVDQVSAALR